MGRSPEIEFAVSRDEFDRLSREYSVVPVWTEIAADLETPVSAYLKLADERPSFLLESVEHGERWGRYSFIGLDPFLVMTSRGGEVSFEGEPPAGVSGGTPPEILRKLVSAFSAPAHEHLPPLFAGAVGYLGYDFVTYLEKLPQTTEDDVGAPELMMMFPRTIFAFDHLKQKITVVANVTAGSGYDEALDRARGWISRLGRPLEYEPEAPVAAKPLMPPSSMTEGDYMKAVSRAKEYIADGDIFQVVLSHRFSTKLTADPVDVYRMLRMVNPSPYMFYLSHPQIKVLGSSPEPLVKVQGPSVIQRPIAGTRPRGETEQEDADLEAGLLADEKERAEHVMLVDLSRNDLGRVSKFGSVKVEDLMVVERYSHVMHMVSQVSGELADGQTALDALYASFPAGTVSGAPKIRAMEIIDELEPTRRGPYSGVVGYFDLSGNLDTCIALRTAYVVDATLHIQAGAGIVADSDPATEYRETVNKAGAMLTAVAMAERLHSPS